MKVRLRSLEVSDLDRMYLWENDMSLWNISGYTTPFSSEALSAFIDTSSRAESIFSSGQLRLIIDVDGVAAGCVDLFEFEPRDRRAGVGILVYEERFRRQGIALGALNELIDYAHKILNIENLWAHIPIENCPSVGLFERCGFTKSGVLRHWRLYDGVYSDVAVYQLLKR